MGKINILTIIGARPQFIKAAALSRTIRNEFAGSIKESILHTGQHYDVNMSQIFFDEMNIPKPDINLNIGSGSHAMQTAGMMTGIEEALLTVKPDFVVVYGDTNSTLAAALAGAKLHVPVAHIEAGLRSYNKSMPEEINRITCDHCSTLLFTPTQISVNNLAKEGLFAKTIPPYTIDKPGIFCVGDIMLDNLIYFGGLMSDEILQKNKLTKENFILCTIHRDNNTDIPERLQSIFRALLEISDGGQEILIPLHPRTAQIIESQTGAELFSKIRNNKRLKIVEPVSYLEMIALEKNCSMVISDSGGIQKEAHFFKKPLLIARPETEWVEIVEQGAALICDADYDKLVNAYEHFRSFLPEFKPVYGEGNTASKIAAILASC